MSDGLRLSQIERVYEEIFEALPEPKFRYDAPAARELDEAFFVTLGPSTPSVDYQTMAQGQISMSDTIYVDYVCRCHPEDSNFKILEGRLQIIRSILDIDQPELSLQAIQEPQLFDQETQQIMVRSLWDLEYCIDINPTFD